MRIAIPDWDGRVSPVFDCAGQLLLVDTHHNGEISRQSARIRRTDMGGRALQLTDLGVELLICGAISRQLEAAITRRGIRVISYVCGEIQEVLHALFHCGAFPDHLRMPGFFGHREPVPAARLDSDGSRTGSGRNRRVAVTAAGPTVTSQVDACFHQADYLLVVDGGANLSEKHDQLQGTCVRLRSGAHGTRQVIRSRAEVLITGQIHPRALSVLRAAKVAVYGPATGSVAEAVQQLRNGQLAEIEAATARQPETLTSS